MANLNELDERLFSRQLYVYGKEAMYKMKQSSVLIMGGDGLAIEIAKNLILSGISSVTLCDDSRVTISDLSTNYYLNESDIGKIRLQSCHEKLKQLNPNVKITSTNKIFITDFSSYDVVICANYDNFTSAINLNTMTHALSKSFIMCDTYGLFGSIFCDFNKYKTNDIDGEELKSGVIIEIIINETIITIKTAEPHNLSQDDLIKFDYIDSIDSIGSDIEYCIKYIDRETFSINKNINHEFNVGVKRFIQVKETKTFVFNELKNTITKPTFSNVCYSESDNTKLNTQHVLYIAMKTYKEQCLNNPTMKPYSNWSKESADEIINIAKQLNNNNFDINIATKFANVLSGQLMPIVSIIGSLVSQEAIKMCSHKYLPMEWYHLESIDCLNNIDIRDNNININSRYSGQLSIFGEKFQKKLNESTIFVAGSGAIGCEHLKNFSMMGVNIIVTDMDTIERSNLSRQFLFHNDDIGSMKSETAVREAKKMNPNINIIAHQNKIGDDTLSIYNETFFKGITCVTGALDNIEARKYVDGLCVKNKKPLLEAGTMGTKCNVQVIIPFMTESYGSTRDPPEKSIPLCTIKNFPYLIEHTIQWARDIFEGLFTNGPINVQKYLDNNKIFENLNVNEALPIFEDLELFLREIPNDFLGCINFGYNYYNKLFCSDIIELLNKYGPNSVTSSGTPFWSGSKKCPAYEKFNKDNELHFNFVFSLAVLWANVFGLPILNDKGIIYKYFDTLNPYEYKQIDNNNNSDGVERIIIDINIETIIDKIKSYKIPNNFKVNSIEFEKDSDTNYHVDFITYTSNLRANNYSIPNADKFKTKGIAGKIIPAIATTTGFVSGLVALEYYKVLSRDIINEINNNINDKIENLKIEKYRNWFCNLALSYVEYTEPIAAKIQKIKTYEYSFWNTIEFKGNPSPLDIINYYKNKYDIDLTMIAFGKVTVYSDMQLFGSNNESKKNTNIFNILETLLNKKIESPITLELIFDDDDDEDGLKDTPTCIIYS